MFHAPTRIDSQIVADILATAIAAPAPAWLGLIVPNNIINNRYFGTRWYSTDFALEDPDWSLQIVCASHWNATALDTDVRVDAGRLTNAFFSLYRHDRNRLKRVLTPSYRSYLDCIEYLRHVLYMEEIAMDDLDQLAKSRNIQE